MKELKTVLEFYKGRLKEARKEEPWARERGKFFEGYNKATQVVLECVMDEFSQVL